MSLLPVPLMNILNGGKHAGDIVKEKKLRQISDADELHSVVLEVIKNNNKSVLDYKKGKTQAITYLMGQVMKTTRGRANPALVKNILVKELGEI